MKRKRRRAKLGLIKPAGVEPETWTMLTAARGGQRGKMVQLLAADPGRVQLEYWYTRPLHFAVREGHLHIVQLLLDGGDDSTWVRYGHEDLMVVARDRGHEAVAQLLADDRRRHNVDRARPIHTAAGGGDTAAVEVALRADEGQVGVGDGEGWTPLHHAVHGGHRATVALLCQRGASVAAVQRGGSPDWYRARNQRPIDIALRNNDPTMVGFLLAHGAEYTLDLAAQDGDVETVRRLCRSRTSRRHRGGQALTIAARAGQAKLVRALVRGGVEPTQPVPDAPRGAALWHAAAQGHLAIAEMLLEAGADPNAWIESSGAPIHQAKDDAMKALLYRYGAKAKNAADFVLGDDIDALRVLIEHDPAAVAGAGCGSVYTFAVAFNKVAALDLLLSSGIPVPPVVTECRTYLWRRPELARRLLAAGMDPNLPNWQWQTPLHNIAEMNPMWVRKGRNNPVQRRERAHRQTLVDLFLEFGADIDVVDEEYRSTPLGWAARQGQDDVVELLLERGADPSGGEAWARPHAWAERRKHGKIARRLKRAGAR